MIQSIMERSPRIQLRLTSGKPETSGINLRKLSISFSQETFWFQLGMLWDAKALEILNLRCGIISWSKLLHQKP
jgi:hypothetical protein